MTAIALRFIRLWFLLLAFAISPVVAHADPGSRSHGPGGIAPLATVLLHADVHSALALTPAQEAQWSALQAAERNLRAQVETERTNLQAIIAAEFADPIPDLVAIENAIMADRAAGAAASAVISTQAVALSSSLSTGQQAIVVAAAQTNVSHRSRRS
jgi:hypothetical protein